MVILLVLLLLLCSTYVFYLWFTYIDETIKTGSGYGLHIGDNKKVTYEKVRVTIATIESSGTRVFAKIISQKEYAEILTTKPGDPVMVEAILDPVGFERLKKEDVWTFYIGGSNYNALQLKFCKERLSEIYRHRRYFEFP